MQQKALLSLVLLGLMGCGSSSSDDDSSGDLGNLSADNNQVDVAPRYLGAWESGCLRANDYPWGYSLSGYADPYMIHGFVISEDSVLEYARLYSDDQCLPAALVWDSRDQFADPAAIEWTRDIMTEEGLDAIHINLSNPAHLMLENWVFTVSGGVLYPVEFSISGSTITPGATLFRYPFTDN
ncbi:MAG: hypothetical protein SV765_03890 [Pseudomonadota bacterium]|nr:hypothetical protein [Pseudomonadales bacterium]MDY6919337.1 hypothetical protein [Pseudomonadota bacterium]